MAMGRDTTGGTGAPWTVAVGRPVPVRNETLQTALNRIREVSNCEAVGIRLLNDDGVAPYDISVGSPERFCLHRNRLSLHNGSCLCSHLLRNADVSNRIPITRQRTFTAGSARELNKAAGALGSTTRLCVPEIGVETLALTVISHQKFTLGLIHCADHRANRLPETATHDLEQIAGWIGKDLALDAMWPPDSWAAGGWGRQGQAACPMCGRWRARDGYWHTDRRRAARVQHWTIRCAQSVICPECRPYHDTE